MMKKGTYYIGDPCFVFGKSWDKVLEEYWQHEGEEFKLLGKLAFIDGTDGGVGFCYDQDGVEYPVDAGLIGCLPASLLKIDNVVSKKEILEKKFGRIVKFDQDFACDSTAHNFTFGHIKIVTNDKDLADLDEDVCECCGHRRG